MRVLKLSTMWCIDALRSKAIRSADQEVAALVDNGRVVEKILLGKQYRVSRWLLEGYEALGKRDAHLSVDEREQLGLESAFRVWELREEYWAWSRSHSPATDYIAVSSSGWGRESSAQSGRNRNSFDFQSPIRRIFAQELIVDPDYDTSRQSSTRNREPG